MASFTITPLTDLTGVEVIGLDFTQPIDTENRAVLRRAAPKINRRRPPRPRPDSDMASYSRPASSVVVSLTGIAAPSIQEQPASSAHVYPLVC